MTILNKRIKKIRQEANLTQREFAEKLGIKQNTVASYEMGRIGISDSVIISICREFNVNEDWIRNGNPPMYKENSKNFETYLGQISKGNDDFIKDLIEVYMELDQSSRDALREIAKKFVEKQNERGQC